MAISWEIDLFFDREQRDVDECDGMEEDYYYGRPVYRVTVSPDSFENGSSGSLGIYTKDELDDGRELMKTSETIKDDGLIGINATRVGEPDVPDVEDDQPDRADADVQ